MKAVERRPTYSLTVLALVSMLAPAIAGSQLAQQQKGKASDWQCIADLDSDWLCKTPLHKAYTQTLNKVTTDTSYKAVSPHNTNQHANWQCIAEPHGDWQCRTSSQTAYQYPLDEIKAPVKQTIANTVNKTTFEKEPIPQAPPASIHAEKGGEVSKVAVEPINKLEVLQQEIEVLTEALASLNDISSKTLADHTLPQATVTQETIKEEEIAAQEIHETSTTQTQPARPLKDTPSPATLYDDTPSLPFNEQLNNLVQSLSDQPQPLLARNTEQKPEPEKKAGVALEKTADTAATENKVSPTRAPEKDTAKQANTPAAPTVFEQLLAETLSVPKAPAPKAAPSLKSNDIASISKTAADTNEKTVDTPLAQTSTPAHQPVTTLPIEKTPQKREEKSSQSRHRIARLLMAEQMNSEAPFSSTTIASIKRENHQSQPLIQHTTPHHATSQHILPRHAVPITHAKPSAQMIAPHEYHHQLITRQYPTPQIEASASYYQTMPESIQLPEQTLHIPQGNALSQRHQRPPQRLAQLSSGLSQPAPSAHYSYRQHLAPMIAASRKQQSGLPYHQAPAISTKDMLNHMKASVEDKMSSHYHYRSSYQKSNQTPTEHNATLPISSAERLQQKAHKFDADQQKVREAQRPSTTTSQIIYPDKTSPPYSYYNDALNTPPQAMFTPSQPSQITQSASIMNHPDHYFTMQWASAMSRKEVEQLKQRYPELVKASIVTSMVKGQTHYLLINGIYKDMHTALSSLRQPAWQYLARALNPWARTLSSLKQQHTPTSSLSIEPLSSTLPQGGYTIQWTQSANLHDLQKLKQSYPQLMRAKILQLSRAQQILYVLVEGVYPDRLTTLDALSQPNLATLSQQLQPKARPLASLHSATLVTPKINTSDTVIPGTAATTYWPHGDYKTSIGPSTMAVSNRPVKHAYTIQWLASDNPIAIEHIQRRYPALHSAVIINRQNRYILVQGSFDNAAAARHILNQPHLQQAALALNPWVRPVTSLSPPDTM